mgnify:CR=1 FL=1
MENAILSNIRQDMSKIQLSGLGIPAIVLLIISMLILPLPSFLLDFLFAIGSEVTIFNIGKSLSHERTNIDQSLALSFPIARAYFSNVIFLQLVLRREASMLRE